jgi:Tol biopolymer transport system component
LEKHPKQRLRDIGDALLDDAGLVPVESRRHHSLFWPATAGLLLIALGGLAAIHFREPHAARPQMIRFQIPFPGKMTPSPRSVPALSPDGRLLAFLADDANGTARVWVHALDSVASRAISGSEGAFGSPFWSANGDYVVFATGKRSPTWGVGVLKKAAVSGGPPQTICEIRPYLRGGFWTPDGKIVFATIGGIFEVAAAGGSPILIKRPSEANLGNPRLLPDGRHFLFDLGGGFWTPRSQGIYLGSIDSKPERQNDRKLLPDQSNAAYVPSDDPNFGYLLFVRDETLMAQRFDTKRLEISGEPIPIAERIGEARPDRFGLFSAASNAALIYRQSGFLESRQLTWLNRNGKTLTTLGEAGDFAGLSLSPNARQAIYTRRERQHQDLWLFEFERRVSRRFTLNGGVNYAPVWSPDGSRVVFASNHGSVPGIHQLPASIGDEKVILDAGIPWDWSRGFEGLLAVLDPEVVLRVDGGLVPAGASRVVRGSRAVAGQALAFSRLGLVVRTANAVQSSSQMIGCSQRSIKTEWKWYSNQRLKALKVRSVGHAVGTRNHPSSCSSNISLQ